MIVAPPFPCRGGSVVAMILGIAVTIGSRTSISVTTTDTILGSRTISSITTVYTILVLIHRSLSFVVETAVAVGRGRFSTALTIVVIAVPLVMVVMVVTPFCTVPVISSSPSSVVWTPVVISLPPAAAVTATAITSATFMPVIPLVRRARSNQVVLLPIFVLAVASVLVIRSQSFVPGIVIVTIVIIQAVRRRRQRAILLATAWVIRRRECWITVARVRVGDILADVLVDAGNGISPRY